MIMMDDLNRGSRAFQSSNLDVDYVRCTRVSLGEALEVHVIGQ